MITEQILRDKLCERLAGQSANQSVDFKINSIISEMLAEENFVKPENMSYNQERSTVSFILYGRCSNRFRLFDVKIKKAKGESHYRFGEHWTDYTLKDFEIDLCGAASVEEAIQAGENRLAEYIQARDNQYAALEEKVRKIQEVLGLETPQQALRACEEIARNSYYLFK